MRHLNTAVFLLLVLSMIDTAAMKLFDRPGIFKVVAGRTVNIGGKLSQPASAEGSQQLNALLTAAPEYDFLRIQFTAVQGRLWRGVLQTDVAAPPGRYAFRVLRQGDLRSDGGPEYQAWLFAGTRGLQKSEHSLFLRALGVPPWWFTVALFPAALWCLYRAYRRTGIEDARMQAKGMGPIYKLARTKQGWEIIFGLGSMHGVQPGVRLQVLDLAGRAVGALTAERVRRESTVAFLERQADIRADYTIARTRTDTGGPGGESVARWRE